MPIHPSAHIEPGARVDATATVGPFCVVGGQARIGPRTRLLGHVVVTGRTTLGADNVVHPFAVLGGPPQDLKYNGENTELVVGDANVVREGVTMNLGTLGGHARGRTEVGSHNLLMAYAHVAHDCLLGDRIVLANSVGLAGHVHIDDGAILGGLAGVHQHCRVGRLAFVGGGSMVAQDVPPFCTTQGDRAGIAGLNVVGLRRAGWTPARVRLLRRALGAVLTDGRPRSDVLAELENSLALESDDVAELCRFVRAARRGICPARLRGSARAGMAPGDNADADVEAAAQRPAGRRPRPAMASCADAC